MNELENNHQNKINKYLIIACIGFLIALLSLSYWVYSLNNNYLVQMEWINKNLVSYKSPIIQDLNSDIEGITDLHFKLETKVNSYLKEHPFEEKYKGSLDICIRRFPKIIVWSCPEKNGLTVNDYPLSVFNYDLNVRDGCFINATNTALNNSIPTQYVWEFEDCNHPEAVRL